MHKAPTAAVSKQQRSNSKKIHNSSQRGLSITKTSKHGVRLGKKINHKLSTHNNTILSKNQKQFHIAAPKIQSIQSIQSIQPHHQSFSTPFFKNNHQKSSSSFSTSSTPIPHTSTHLQSPLKVQSRNYNLSPLSTNITTSTTSTSPVDHFVNFQSYSLKKVTKNSNNSIFSPKIQQISQNTQISLKTSPFTSTRTFSTTKPQSKSEKSTKTPEKTQTITQIDESSISPTETTPKKQNVFIKLYKQYGKLAIFVFAAVYLGGLVAFCTIPPLFPGYNPTAALEYIDGKGFIPQQGKDMFWNVVNARPALAASITAHPDFYTQIAAGYFLNEVATIPRIAIAMGLIKHFGDAKKSEEVNVEEKK
jgi:hypothetical protein